MMANPNRVFLSAEWSNLILCNYPVEDAILEPYLPIGCKLDYFEDRAFVSLVAFQFLNTNVFGFKWLGLTHFFEVNLRFYIRLGNQRGVCFIREYVPSRIIVGVARMIYNEPYKYAPISGTINKTHEQINALYRLTSGDKSMLLDITAKNSPYLPLPNSMEHFFKEHELGVGRSRTGETLTYKVSHPHWEVYPIVSTKVEMAWEMFGPQFSFLNQQDPHSVILAKGSKIEVFNADKHPISKTNQNKEINTVY